MKLSVVRAVCAVALSFAVGIGFADEGKDESGKGKDNGERFSHQEGGGKNRHREGTAGGNTYFHAHVYARLDIPPGHYPPPGECRIWYPDRPPGAQPPPGKCRQVPPGAWVIRHPADLPGHVHVTVYEPRRPGKILVVGQFEIASGAFVRVVLSK